VVGGGQANRGLRAVFLDRDGTLTRAFVREGVSRPPRTEDELEILPGVPEALADLRAARFALIVVTNQPDVARGTLTHATAQRINELFRDRVAVDALMACFHDDADDCACRKPRPGMLLDAAKQFGVDLAASFVIGDRWRDTEAGRRAGCTSIQIRSAEASPPGIRPDFWVANVREAAEIVLHGHVAY
jgi:D-glycero-D-manno-heptose 1,7-bisphosphate phosphatase